MATERRRGPPNGLVWLLVVLASAGLIATTIVWGPSLYQLVQEQDEIRSWVARLGPSGPLGIVALQVGQTLLAPIPGQAIGAVSGYLYGTWWGTLYAMAGVVLGSLIGFLLARNFGRPLLERWVRPHTLARLDHLAQQDGALVFFLIWLFPLVPDDLACLAAGLTPMPVRQFLILVTLGRLPGVLVTVWAGANAVQIGLAGWAVLLVGFAVLGVTIWHWRDPLQSALLRCLERLAGLARR